MGTLRPREWMSLTEAATSAGRHVVEQDGISAAFNGLVELLAVAHLYLYALAGFARR